MTPDHAIRTKSVPLVAPAPEAGKLDAFKKDAKAALDKFVADYHAYFAAPQRRQMPAKKELDPVPRVVLVPGVGLFGVGNTSKDAKIAADLAETTVEVIADAERLGTYECIPEPDIFDIEYWSLEQAKLGCRGGEAAGAAHRRRDRRRLGHRRGDGGRLRQGRRRGRGARPRRLQGEGLRHRLRCHRRGAGARRLRQDRGDLWRRRHRRLQRRRRLAGQDRRRVDEATLRESFELNFWAHQSVAQNAVRIMRAQGLGGCLLFNTSKQAVNPGPDFGPYGLPKAATLFLMRQYALDHGADGIRSNAVNADRIRSGLLTDEMIAQRSKARGLSEADYMGGNLLGIEVTAERRGAGLRFAGQGAQDHGRGGHGRRRQHRGSAAIEEPSSSASPPSGASMRVQEET